MTTPLSRLFNLGYLKRVRSFDMVVYRSCLLDDTLKAIAWLPSRKSLNCWIVSILSNFMIVFIPKIMRNCFEKIQKQSVQTHLILESRASLQTHFILEKTSSFIFQKYVGKSYCCVRDSSLSHTISCITRIWSSVNLKFASSADSFMASYSDLGI